ncbi:FAD-dependent monooxygenase, partial [Klebsiella pneumoniae]
LPVRHRFIAMMPQWDFLNFLATEGRRHPKFMLRMSTEATGLVERDGRVDGVRARGPEGETTVEADLVIAADGRHSVLRGASDL